MESEILPHVGADAHIGPAGRTILTENTAFFRMTRVVFPIPFVGADDPVRPSKFVEFSWPFVGADAYIGPLKMLRFRIGFP